MPGLLTAALLLALALAPGAAAEAPPGAAFAVLSDIHVNADGAVPSAFAPLVARLAALRPGFIIVTGDFTGGNPDDTFDAERVRRWWAAVKAALKPFSEAGIPLLPVAGNHDSYRPVHRQGYAQAWVDLRAQAGGLKLKGDPPWSYSFDAAGVHFTLMNVVGHHPDPAMEKWALEDIARSAARLKLGFGHVPLASVMGRTDEGFRDGFGARLAEAGLGVYICGHEHLVWDETLAPGGRPLRQLIVGTASASYTFPLGQKAFEGHCRGSRCEMPHAGEAFSLVPGSRQQAQRQTFMLGEVSADGLKVRLMALDSGGAVAPFYDAAPAK